MITPLRRGTVIEQLDKGKVPKTPKTLASEAETEIKDLSAPTKIEDTMGGRFRKTTRWALDPTTIPGVKTP